LFLLQAKNTRTAIPIKTDNNRILAISIKNTRLIFSLNIRSTAVTVHLFLPAVAVFLNP
jgi:hypothetical protein